MALIHKIFKGGSDFLKSIKSDNKKELHELENLEKKITQLKAEEKKNNYQFMFTNRTFLKFWVIGMIVIFLAYITFQSLSIIYLIFAAYIVSLALEAIIDFFQRKLSHRGLAIAISYILLIVLLLGGFIFIIPFIFNQLAKIMDILVANISHIQELLKTQSLTDIITNARRIPGAVKNAFLQSVSDPAIVSGLQSKLQQNITQLIDLGRTYARDIGNIAVGFVGNFFSFIAQASIVLTLAVLFSIQKDSVMKFISGLGGEKQYKFVYMKLERIYKKLGIRLKSQLFLCLFIGGMMYLGLWILAWFGINVPQKGTLALIAGLTELIPYVGPLIGGTIAALVAFINVGFYAVLFVIGIGAFIQWLENNILIPVLMHKTLGVNPVLIFISMIIGGMIMGVVGVLLAVPIAVIITLIMEKTLEE